MGFDEKLQREVLDDSRVDTVDAHALDRTPDDKRARRLWRDWLGRETEFYQGCAAAAAQLHWQDIEGLGGQHLAMLADDTRTLCRDHNDLKLPERLRTGCFEVLGSSNGQLWLRSYSSFDPLAVSPDVLVLAARCDGRPTEDIVAEHAMQSGHSPTRLQLRTLVDFGIIEAD
jgi:hypothetical protein